MRFLKFLLLFPLLVVMAFGQASTPAALPVAVNQNGVPLGTTLVTICTTNPGVGTCAVPATLYTDATITTVCSGSLALLNNSTNPSVGSGCSNPGYTDGLGNVVAYSTGGQNWCQYSGPTIATYSQPCFFPGSSSSGNPYFISQYCGSNTSCTAPGLSPADESGAILAAETASGCSKNGGCYIIDDMCGIQTWSVQPFVNGTKALNGVFTFQSNCAASNPHIVSIDGTSTITTPDGLWVVGQGTAQGELTPQYGSPGGNQVQGTFIRACNPTIYPCIHGGFVVQSGTIASTTASLNTIFTSLITMSGKPFTFNGTAINNLQQYRLVHIVGSSVPTNNAAWVVTDCNAGNPQCSSNPQGFHISAPVGFLACSSNCGTAYLDTPIVSIGSGGGNGVFGNQWQNMTISCSFMPGTIGVVNAIGQELSSWRDIAAWDCPVAGFRIDQSVAYNGASFASSNSGPYGPSSANFQGVTCGLSGGCACFGSSGSNTATTVACSSSTPGVPGTVPTGSTMSCGGGVNLPTIYPDPCVNSSYVGFLFTGGTGQQGFGPYFHITSTINDKSGSGGNNGIPQIGQATTGGNTYSAGGVVGSMFACAAGFFGIHGLLEDFHWEYYYRGLCVGGDPTSSPTYYYAYTNTTSPAHNIITSGVTVDGGFAGAANSVAVDIGGSLADAPVIGDITIRGWNLQNGGGAALWQNNISGEICNSYGTAPGGDVVLTAFFGHTNTQTNAGQSGLPIPQELTSCSNLSHFTGNSFSVPLQTNLIVNGGSPVKETNAPAGIFITTTTDTGPGIVIGVAYHTSVGSVGPAMNQIVTTGLVPMTFDTAGTGNCSSLGMFVVVGTHNNGRVQCTATYTAGTVIGVNLSTTSTTNTSVNVLVGLR